VEVDFIYQKLGWLGEIKVPPLCITKKKFMINSHYVEFNESIKFERWAGNQV
jgi:hypothetical protein